jgi:hypothetical protein
LLLPLLDTHPEKQVMFNAGYFFCYLSMYLLAIFSLVSSLFLNSIGVDSLVLGDLYASNQTSYMRAWHESHGDGSHRPMLARKGGGPYMTFWKR